jgi:hypothetical protein
MNELSQPTFLDGYDVFAELEKWRRACKYDHPWWELTSEEGEFRCELSFFGKAGSYTKAHVAPTPQEAVYGAINRFRVEVEGIKG